MILVTHFACCHQYKGYWRSCPLGWSYFTVMPGLNLRAGGAHAPEFTIDAMQIALYGLAYWQELQPTKLPEDTYRELQLLARQYYQMTSMLIKAKVDFNAICDQVLPGMQELMNDHAGRHKLSDFVLRYRHTTHILEMGETRFRKDYCKWAEKRDTAIANVWQHSSLPQLKTVSLCFPMHHPRRSSLRKRYESSTQWRRPVTLF